MKIVLIVMRGSVDPYCQYCCHLKHFEGFFLEPTPIIAVQLLGAW